MAVWSTACVETIKATFGSGSNHVSTFWGPMQVTVSRGGGDSYDNHDEVRDAGRVTRRLGVLGTLIEQLDLEIGYEVPAKEELSFWDDIHPVIRRVAQARYEGGHFADCVEAALKEINAVVKEHVKRKTNQELDGAPLMRAAFSPNKPVVVLEDVNTDSGRNTQQGYMEIYAGAMTGIRNPKAHANIVINAIRARHFIYLASLLAFKFDERL